MPYIKNEQRKELEPELGALIQKMLSMPEFLSNGRAGILNYVITVLIDSAYGPLSDAKYKDYNEAIGMLECCKLEFYRKAAAPYEDIKEKQNGKVLDGEMLGKNNNPSEDIPFNITKEECINGKTDLIFLIRPNDKISIFIRANTYMDATHKLDNIIMEEKLDFKVCDISHYLVAYKKWENLESEIKNTFEAKERDGLNSNFVIFIKIRLNKGYNLTGKDLTRQHPIPANLFEHGLNRTPYPVGTFNEEFKYMRELIYPVDKSSISEFDCYVVFKLAINKNLSLFILGSSREDAEEIMNKWLKRQYTLNRNSVPLSYIELGDLTGYFNFYKNFCDLERKIKDVFLVGENNGIPKIILFSKNKKKLQRNGIK